MIKALAILLTGIVTSFFFFPFVFTFFTAANTKMMMAACGLVVFLMQMAKNRRPQMRSDLFNLSLMALAVSLASFATMVYNSTPDNSYLSYIVSMWTWLGAGYFAVQCIKYVHGRVTYGFIVSYLVAVCVFQCLLAIAIDSNVNVKMFVDSILDGEGFMGKNPGRLYGLGCALDVAGGRFSAVLVLLVGYLCQLVKSDAPKTKYGIALLVISYFLIALIGNMIARTTILGVGLSLIYLFIALLFSFGKDRPQLGFLRWFFGLFLVCGIIVATNLYQNDSRWQHNIKFGFEGFFSLVEKGKWEVSSNEQLKGTFITPDNARCWIIGDGRMASTSIDPYYVGKTYKGFYMMTDVGYSRFLFYFGLIGLTCFSLFIIVTGMCCAKRLPSVRIPIMLVVLLNFIIWFKVSTDIFLVFCPLLCLPDENEVEEDDIEAEEMCKSQVLPTA